MIIASIFYITLYAVIKHLITLWQVVAFLRTKCVKIKSLISLLKDAWLLTNAKRTPQRIGRFIEKPQSMTNWGQESTKQLRDRSQGFEDVDPFSKNKWFIENAPYLLTFKRLLVI